MSRFVLIIYRILVLLKLWKVCAEEPCAPALYLEQRLLEKMVEIDYKMQKIIERFENLEKKDHTKTEVPRSTETCTDQFLTVAGVETEGWQMIFRAIAGNGQDVYKAWTTGVGTCTYKPSTFERSYSCHYRNNIVSNWASLGIQYVKFAFFDSSKEVANVIFSGKDSDMNNWFDKSRVVSSSWSDLSSTSDFNYFSIAGHYSHPRLDRRFFINKLYNTCPGDLGHIAVINSEVPSPVCLFDSHASYPQFIYSKINSVDFWNRRMFGTADYMAIFIKIA